MFNTIYVFQLLVIYEHQFHRMSLFIQELPYLIHNMGKLTLDTLCIKILWFKDMFLQAMIKTDWYTFVTEHLVYVS